MSVHTVLFAQSNISNKLSITTQLFLLDRDSKYAVHRKLSSAAKAPAQSQTEAFQDYYDDENRIYAASKENNGISYIAAFIRVNDDSKIYELETKGVRVMCRFKDGIITANIPVDSVESVASISNVNCIEVASIMHPASDSARVVTNTNDILTYSPNAQLVGLKKHYDGKGVILGVIDNGIDFQHIAFKDKYGNSRIKGAYIYEGKNNDKIYTSISETEPETDNENKDHGTHTASTAGGSSVIINGDIVSVTDNHEKATYGGIAPGVDLYLAGLIDYNNVGVANAIKYICDYADSVNKPVVINNSWGHYNGPHDGTGSLADVIAQYFGEKNLNHICLFASHNLAGMGKQNGGYYISGTASASQPLGSVLYSKDSDNLDGGCSYSGIIANACMRSVIGSDFACNILILDSNTGNLLDCINVQKKKETNQIVLSLNNNKYYEGVILVDYDHYESGKNQIVLRANIKTRRKTPMEKDGVTFYKSDYVLAVQFYPVKGSATIDVWGGYKCYFSDNLSTDGYTWVRGSDDSSVSDEATYPNIITVGAYVSKNVIKDYSGIVHDYSYKYTIGDITDASGYQKSGCGVTGQMIPWITAPGTIVVAAVNKYHKDGGFLDGTQHYLMNSDKGNPYGSMTGTSMATPIVSGIVALWLQAATELGLSLTTSDVKNIMKYTAIKDKFTNGENASHFGNGKIDALAGIKAIVAPELTLKHDDYYNKLFVNFKTFVCPCTVSVSCLNKVYPKEVAREIIKNYNDTLSFNTDYWERGKYYIEIKYGNKNIIDTVMLNHVGRQPKLDAKIKGEYIVVNFKFSDRNTKGELRMYKSSEFCKKGFNASPIYSDNVDMTDYGDYLIEKKYFNTNDVVFALFENGRCVAMTAIDSSSNVFASIQKNQQKLNVMYQIPSLSKDAYIEISKKTKSDVKLALKDAVYTNGNNIDGTIRRYVDSEECEFGSEMFDCTDWEDGDYTISLCLNGHEMSKTDIHISRSSAIKRVVKYNNSVNITYDLGKEAKTAYVVVTDIDGTMRYVKKLSLSSTNCSIEGNFRDCKFVNVLLYVDGVLVSCDKY